MTEQKASYAGWAIVEVMGHRLAPGKVSEETQFGAVMCRVDSYAPGDEEPFRTQYYPGGSIYCLTPCSEETAREAARYLKPRDPVLMELPARRDRDDEDEDVDPIRVEDPEFRFDLDGVDASHDQPTYRS